VKEPVEILLAGIISEVPIIVCKNDDAAMLIQAWSHTHLTHRPAVIVAEEWPEDADYEAVVVTPLHVLGSTEKPDFSIKVVKDLSPTARDVLNAMIRLASAGEQPEVRSIAAAAYGQGDITSKRKVVTCLHELEKAGLIARVHERGPWKLLFGRWRPDAAAAKAAGIAIDKR